MASPDTWITRRRLGTAPTTSAASARRVHSAAAPRRPHARPEAIGKLSLVSCQTGDVRVAGPRTPCREQVSAYFIAHAPSSQLIALKIFSDDGARTTSKRLEHGVAPQWEQRLYNGTPGRDHVPPPFSPHASSNQFVGASPFKTFPAALHDGVQHLERPWPGGRIVADGAPGVFVPPPGDDAAPQPQAKPLAGAPASGAPRTVSPTHLDDGIGLKWLRRTDVTSSSAVGAPAVAKLHPRRARAGFVAEFVAALCLVAALASICRLGGAEVRIA